jgi:hypothetical protein
MRQAFQPCNINKNIFEFSTFLEPEAQSNIPGGGADFETW